MTPTPRVGWANDWCHPVHSGRSTSPLRNGLVNATPLEPSQGIAKWGAGTSAAAVQAVDQSTAEKQAADQSAGKKQVADQSVAEKQAVDQSAVEK